MTRIDYRAIDKMKLREAPCPTLQQELRVVLSEAAFDRTGRVLAGEAVVKMSGRLHDDGWAVVIVGHVWDIGDVW